MTVLLPILAALLAGVGVALQPPTNAALAKASGSILLAATVSFASGTLILLALWLAFDRTPLSSLRGVPWWAWMGGAYGVYFVSAGAFASPRLGLGVMLTVLAVSQLATALTVDHFGLVGMAREPVSVGRVAGVVLVIAGVMLVRRG